MAGAPFRIFWGVEDFFTLALARQITGAPRPNRARRTGDLSVVDHPRGFAGRKRTRSADVLDSRSVFIALAVASGKNAMPVAPPNRGATNQRSRPCVVAPFLFLLIRVGRQRALCRESKFWRVRFAGAGGKQMLSLSIVGRATLAQLKARRMLSVAGANRAARPGRNAKTAAEASGMRKLYILRPQTD